MGYDLCICIHAEQKAIANAARDGVAVGGGTMYVNVRPCLNCLVVAHNAGISRLFYQEDWSYPEEIEKVYWRLASAFETFEHRAACGSSARGALPGC
jgi:dCMP deaminase